MCQTDVTEDNTQKCSHPAIPIRYLQDNKKTTFNTEK